MAPSSDTARPGAVSRGYDLASSWEQHAPASQVQLRALDLLAHHCSQQGQPGQAAVSTSPPAGEEASSSSAPGVSEVSDEAEAAPEEAVLESSHQFYRWHLQLEAARTAETEDKYRSYADTLSGHLQAADSLVKQVEGALGLFEQLVGQQRAVSARTQALHDSCQSLAGKKDGLEELAAALRSKLHYFDELEAVAAQFHSASLQVDAERFLPLLARLDECIAYVSANPQYADSAAYASRFRALHARALALLRSRVAHLLKAAAEQVQAYHKSSQASRRQSGSGSSSSSSQPLAAANGHAPAGAGVAADGAQAALLYVRFRAVAEPVLKGLLAGVEERAGRPEYAALLSDCTAQWCTVRLGLVGAQVEAGLAALAAASLPLPGLLRAGTAQLMQVCQMEHQLFEAFFPRTAGEGGGEALGALLDPLATALYDALRPRAVQLTDLDQLAALVDLLQTEVLEEGLGRRGEVVAPLRAALARVLADCQQRLIFRAQTFIREAVAGFQPAPGDLDYPARLRARPSPPAAHANGAGASADGDASADEAAHARGAHAGEVEGGQGASANWYPPVAATLDCLSKLYRCLQPRIFSGLAQDAVASCTAAVQAGSKQVARSSGVLDGQLFMIKQLLILREQIAPFEADFTVTEKDLDFSHMRDHLRRIMAGQASLFTLSYDNPIVQLVYKGGPRVLENQVDSKRELEVQLKATCEAFIMTATKLAVEPLLSFITKVTAVRVAAHAAAAARPLREQAFAEPARVAELVGRVREALAGPLPAAVAKMKLYLDNPSTHTILFKPIKSNIAEAHGQIAALLEAEYTPEEAAAIHLTTPPELAAILDNL